MRWFYNLVYILTWLPVHGLYRLRVSGRENIPDGPCIVCADHSNFIDPLIVAIAFGIKHFLHSMSKQENMDMPVLGWIYKMLGAYGVRRGEQDVNAVRTTMSLLKKGEKVLIFPEGTRTREDNADAAKTGAVRFAAKLHVPVVPVFLTRNKSVFHRAYVRIGEPFVPAGKTPEELHAETIWLMEAIYALGEEK